MVKNQILINEEQDQLIIDGTYYKKYRVALGFNFELCSGMRSIINLLLRTEQC